MSAQDKNENIVDSLEDLLEERKSKNDRRTSNDPDSPYNNPANDRRSGKDRRDEK